MSSSLPPAGGAIEGKYEVVGKLREGGMGAIYLVRHRLLNELRVIKVMRPEVAESADSRKRFLREAQTATRLKHPNIVGFYDFFIDDEGTAYMVMEYIDGINMRDIIRNCGALPISLALYLAGQGLSALDYLHRKGIVHRDIAPDNIMMTQEEDGTLQAKLIDLGIAKLARSEEQDQLTAADEFIGKLRYSSPEQLTKRASSAAIDGRSDIFSFGIVLYEMLTGICPYVGGSLQDILTARLQKPPMPFTQSDPNGRLGAVLRGTILKALQTKPEERYQTAAEFAKAIEGLPASEASPETPDQVRDYVRNAVDAARKAAAANPGAVSGLQRTLQSKFRVSEISVRPLEATDKQVEQTISRLGADIPVAATQTNQDLRGDDRTLAYAGPRGTRGAPPLERTVREEKKPRSFLGYAIAAAAAAALVVLGIVVANTVSNRKRDETVSQAVEPTAPAAAPTSAPLATQPPPTAAPAVEARPTSAPPTAAPTLAEPVREAKKQVRTPRSSRPADRPTLIAEVIPPGKVQPGRPKQRFCAEISRTGYFQGVPKEVPPGFKDVAGLPARDDAARIRIGIAVLPESPAEGEEFTVVATFLNGGDGAFRLVRAEASAPGARGGFEPIAGVATPTAVDEGGKLELYRTRRALGAGETYHKTFRVVEQRRNDAWEASVTVKPCVEQ